MKMATKMTTKHLLVFHILILGICYAIKDVSYRVDGVRDSLLDGLVLEEDPGLYSRIKRQLPDDPVSTPGPTSPTTPTSAMEPTTTTTSEPTTTTTASTTTTTGPPTTTFPDVDFVNDTHVYYTSLTYRNNMGGHYFVESSELDQTQVHASLSNNHRSASTVQMSFRFPFYGHDVRQVTIATGGFLYMSDFLHQWLTATQYIAPLMANFDTRLGGNESRILYADTGDIFYVWWENVFLADESDVGGFTFQVQLHRSGMITFAYKTIPKDAHLISTDEHPVKIGLSDAYYIDTDLGGNMKRRTIYEYHRVEIALASIQTLGAVKLTPERLCHDQRSCKSCTTSNINNFECVWCEDIKECSDGFYRNRQEWLESSCHRSNVRSVEQCTATSTTIAIPNSSSSPVPTTTNTASVPVPTTSRTSKTTASIPSGHTPQSIANSPQISHILNTTSNPASSTKTWLFSTEKFSSSKVQSTVKVTSPKVLTTSTKIPSTTTVQVTTSPKLATSTDVPGPTFNDKKTTNDISTTTVTHKVPSTKSSRSRTETPFTSEKMPNTPSPSTTSHVARIDVFHDDGIGKHEADTPSLPSDPENPEHGHQVSDKDCTGSHKKGVKDCSKIKDDDDVVGGALAAIILVVLLVVALIIVIVAWFVYAYKNPNSKAGRWLIEHRPSQLRQQIAQKVRFWKKDDSGDKYAVSVGGESVA